MNTILYTQTNGVATITLNRPQSLNAFTDEMIRETTEAVTRAARDRAIRCITLTGAGRGFSSGQDLADIKDRGEDFSIGNHLRGGYHRLVKAILQAEKPVIGAINGAAAGAGCGVALACDYRILSENAFFMLAFTKIGLIPDSGVNWLLPRLVGYARAYQLALTAERLPAQKALEWGLANRVVSEEQFSEVVQHAAAQFAQGASLAFGLTKRAMLRGFDQSLEQALDYEAELQDVAGRSADSREGVAAFLEKRPARFAGL